ncbi:hypothetical protein M3Y97_00806600 [Aphelenchoides bicaudatus]|nr:hypothetical protein M3Y97_00806600 [Aphelenchoides bicaudatus]
MKHVPIWAWYAFITCFALIIIFLILDYLVIRRNALGNTCCIIAPTRPKRHDFPSPTNNLPNEFRFQKHSTNMVLQV